MSLENLQHIDFICGPGDEKHLESYLQDMSKEFQYNMSPQDFTRILERICASITRPHLEKLLFRRLWAEYLLAPNPWVRDRLVQHCPLIFITGFDPEKPEAGAGNWVKIPVPLVRDDKARVAWFIAGLIPLPGPLFIPQWAKGLMDQQFLAGIDSALRLVRSDHRSFSRDFSNHRFVVFPLAAANGMVQFKGGSAALGLSLGMKSLVEKQPISHKVIATGCLDSAGNVETVGFLDQKVKNALKQKFKCVIHPIQARSIQYGFDQTDKNMDRFPGAWLDLQKSAVCDLLTDIFADMGQFGRFADRFFAMTREFSRHQTASTLARLAPDTIPGQWPMAALIWCTANLALANHLGQITQARIWEQQGKDAAKKVMRLDPDKSAEFFNTLLVNAHNRFEFKINLPGPLRDLLALLEKRHGVMSESGCVIDQALGRLYGTLVQNAAFCGPDHINETEAWSEKARKALGENIAPELKPEWMRQYSYLGQARLCAKDMEGAQHCLCKYFGVENTEQIVPKKYGDLDQWQTAMLCRFLATGGISVPDKFYTRLVSHVKRNAQSGHPWQLTCFNLGRAAMIRNDKKNAAALFQQSCNICLTQSLGPAIEIMALKPLAFLQHLIPTPEFESRRTSWEQQIKAASWQLNQNHFFFLHDHDFYGALAHVRANHDSIFPFSYG